jgi:hypothetical protein
MAQMKKMIRNEIISKNIKELNEELFMKEVTGAGEMKKTAAVGKFSRSRIPMGKFEEV